MKLTDIEECNKKQIVYYSQLIIPRQLLLLYPVGNLYEDQG